MLVLLSSPLQGDGEEDRRSSSSSSDCDSEGVTTSTALCWDLAGLRDLHVQTPVWVSVVGAIEYLRVPGDGKQNTQHSPHMVSVFFLFLPQDHGSDKNDEKEDED